MSLPIPCPFEHLDNDGFGPRGSTRWERSILPKWRAWHQVKKQEDPGEREHSRMQGNATKLFRETQPFEGLVRRNTRISIHYHRSSRT